MSEQPSFLTGVTVTCFFPACGHAEWSEDPLAAHDAMERHYDAGHEAEIHAYLTDGAA